MDTACHSFSVPRTARWWLAEPVEKAERRGTLIVLHGYGQLPEYFIRKFRPLAEAGWHVIAPEGAHRFYLQGTEGRVGASWMTKEARLDDIADQTVFLDALLGQLKEGLASGPRVLLGFSQGVATALRWAALGGRGASWWDGIIAHSGVIPSDLRSLDGSLADAPRLDLIVGTKDPYIQDRDDRFRRAEAAWVEGGGDPDRLRLHTFDGGHDVDIASVQSVLKGLG